MPRFFLFLLLLTLPGTGCLKALPIDEAQARDIAAAFLKQKRYARAGRAVRTELTLRRSTATDYLFTAPSGHFVLVAADDRLPSLLGYGTAGEGTVPPALSALLQQTEARLPALYGKAAARKDQPAPVPPLLGAVRHQEVPFNGCCPFYKADDGSVSGERCVVGCVATALEEIISYYRREVVLLDTLHGWTTPHYEIPDILPGTRVDTRLVRDRYDAGTFTEAEADAVARLSYYCGVAARMNWGTNESGARIDRLVEPLRRAFGYRYVHYLDSNKYDPQEWLSLLENEIQSHRPVLYAAYTMHMGGHAFVLDGLDSEGLFHVNWGYGGDFDGFFRLDVLNSGEPVHDRTEEGSTMGFFCNQEALLLCPDATDAVLPDTLRRTGLEIVVDSLRFDLPPETGKYTPLRLYLRNTADYAVTTPLELFTNATTDTAFFEQGDYIALTGGTLEAGETRMFPVRVRFNHGGSRVLRISPDDIRLIHEQPLTVGGGRAARLTFEAPRLSFPESTVLHVRQDLANEAGAGRAGHIVTYDLCEGKGGEDAPVSIRHGHYIYTAAGTSQTDTVSFRGLTPEREYTLQVRCPWTVVQRVTFTMPRDMTGLGDIPADTDRATETWFSPDGRRVCPPLRPGTYLRRRGSEVRKILIE